MYCIKMRYLRSNFLMFTSEFLYVIVVQVYLGQELLNDISERCSRVLPWR